MLSDAIPPVVAELRSRLPELSREFGVRQLWVFGSVARGEATEQSDIDIAVEFSAPPTFRLYCALEERLEQATNRRVHLVSRDRLKPLVRERVDLEAIQV